MAEEEEEAVEEDGEEHQDLPVATTHKTLQVPLDLVLPMLSSLRVRVRPHQTRKQTLNEAVEVAEVAGQGVMEQDVREVAVAARTRPHIW